MIPKEVLSRCIEKDASADISIAINGLQNRGIFADDANNQLLANHKFLLTKANKFCL